MTATVPLWGKMADLYSKKLLIQLSLGLFVVGSLIAGFTPNVGVLILSRGPDRPVRALSAEQGQDGRRPTEVRGEGGSAQPSRPTRPETQS